MFLYKILWLSRHNPTPAQKKELRRVFGTPILIQQPITISSGKEVKDLMEKYQCGDVVVVLPPDLLQDVVQCGIKPLRAVMDRKTGKHLYFERVCDMYLKTEVLVPNDGGLRHGTDGVPGGSGLRQVQQG